MSTRDYIFRSERLGFRNWQAGDLPEFSAMNADPEVMRFFPTVLSREESDAFVWKMQKQFRERGFCYFAVDILKEGKFIGFIGISEKDFEADFTPCIDIGWRLARHAWGHGYATEGARKCLEFAFSDLRLREIVAIAPCANKPSEKVMQKIGMKKVKELKHPQLKEYPALEKCLLYHMVNQA